MSKNAISQTKAEHSDRSAMIPEHDRRSAKIPADDRLDRKQYKDVLVNVDTQFDMLAMEAGREGKMTNDKTTRDLERKGAQETSGNHQDA